MTKRQGRLTGPVLAGLMLLFVGLGCDTGEHYVADANTDSDDGGVGTEETMDPDRWQPIRDLLDASDIENFSFLVGNAEGEVFLYERGDSTVDRVYELGSGSKWPAAATLMRLVAGGVLSLEDRVQDYVPWWTKDESDSRSRITLRHLLSFTSGFAGDALAIPCVEDPNTTLKACAQEIYDGFFSYEPGEVFYYGPPHLQVAGAMAEYATGQPWTTIYDEQLTAPLGLTQTGYLTASQSNPRVAGGAVSSAREYGTFLRMLLSGAILSDSAVLMRDDYTSTGVTIEYSPIAGGMGQEWHYAIGAWRECHADKWEPACNEPGILSSAGVYGWYPWMDVNHGYWAILAMRLRIGADGRPTVRAIQLGHKVQPLIESAL